MVTPKRNHNGDYRYHVGLRAFCFNFEGSRTKGLWVKTRSPNPKP